VTYEGRILFGIRQRHDGLSSVILQLERYVGSGFNSVADKKMNEYNSIDNFYHLYIYCKSVGKHQYVLSLQFKCMCLPIIYSLNWDFHFTWPSVKQDFKCKHNIQFVDGCCKSFRISMSLTVLEIHFMIE